MSKNSTNAFEIRSFGVSFPPEESCAPNLAGVAHVWVWPADIDPIERLVAVGVPVPNKGEITWFHPSDGSDPIGTYADGSVRVAWQINIAAIQDDLAAYGEKNLPPSLNISLEGAAPVEMSTLEEMLENWQDDPVEDLLLQRPLNSRRLVARADENALAGGLLGRTAWVSPILLVILVGLVMTGAGITLRSAAREIRLSRLQTDFVSSISHELRTPLTSIRMFVETLQSERLQDPERVAECLDLLAKETDRLSRMIERVLGWARMEAGRRSYELEDVRADDLVNEALQALRSQHLLGLQSPEIDVDIPEDTPLLRVDRDAIVEALLNLLQNAAKYTPEPRKISVRARVKLPLVGLAVIDNGPGIAKADRNRVFEKFYQADTLLSATSRFGSQRGSGLGLSIVRAAVHGHGGRVTLETELGYGSTFTLWLPLSDSA